MRNPWESQSRGLDATRALARSLLLRIRVLVDRTPHAIAHRPRTTLGGLALLTAAAIGVLVDVPACTETGCRLRLGLDASFTRILPQEGPDWEIYDSFRTAFGTDERVIVALHFQDTVYSAENIERVYRVTRALKRELKEVRRMPLSLTSARQSSGAGSYETSPIVRKIPPAPAQLDRIRSDVEKHLVYHDLLVSEDELTAAVWIDFLRVSDREYIDNDVSARIRETAEREAGNGVQIWIAGGLHLKDAQYRAQLGGLLQSFGLGLVVLVVVLALSFRSSRGVLLPLGAVLLALVWTLGVAVLFGRPLNLVTVLIPPLLLILGVSYAVHVVADHYDAARGRPADGGAADAVRSGVADEALRSVSRPVLLTGVTTAIGFLAMLVQPVEALREFGLLALIGVMFTVLASLTLPPAVLALLPLPDRRPETSEEHQDALSRLAGRAARFSRDHRPAILVGSAVFFAFAVFGTQQWLVVSAESVKAFPADSQIRTDYESINDAIGGANTINVVIRTEAPGQFREPAHLHWIADFQGWLEEQPEIGGTTSVVAPVKICDRAINPVAEPLDPELEEEEDGQSCERAADAPEAIPNSADCVAQIFVLCRGSLRSYITNDHSYTRVSARTRVADTPGVAALVGRIQGYLDEHVGVARSSDPPSDGRRTLPSYFEAHVTGISVLTTDLIGRLVWGQVYSVLGAIVLIYIVLSLQFASPLTGLAALVPNVLPIAAYFGALSLSGVTLNPTTAIIAPMALGIAIDDTIHYMTRFQDESRRTLDEHTAVELALRSVGRPVTITTIALCGGFLVFTFGPLLNQVQLGALGAFTLGFAWLTEFAVTPAICAGVRVVTLWETLTIDLGKRPQVDLKHVFEGLSKRQCRIVALLTSLEERKAGEPLTRIDAPGRDLFVVVEGKLSGRTRPPDAREFSMQRGDVVGVLGCFHPDGKRTADTDVTEDARLLRITPDSLEFLRRRNPRIAAKVFRNLNRYQAIERTD